MESLLCNGRDVEVGADVEDDPEVGPGDDIVSIGPKQENLTAVPGVQSLVAPDDDPEVGPGADSPVN